jgi:predicted Zn-dependent protease
VKNLYRSNRVVFCALIFAAHSHAQTRAGSSLTKPELALLTQCETLEHRFDRRALVFEDRQLDQHLSAIANPLLPDSPPPYVHWRFLVLRDPLVNSFSLPDGTVYLSTGLLSLLENDDQLASVLAHEIAHVTNGDAFAFQREYRKKETVRSVSTLAAVASSSVLGGGVAALLAPDLLAEAIVAEGGRPIQLWIVSGYGDEAEHVADQATLGLLAHSGRDPAQLARTLDLMNDPPDEQPAPTFAADRIKLHQRLKGLRPHPDVDHAGDGKSYFAAAEGAIRANVTMDIDSRRFRTALASARRIQTAHPDDARALFLLGEAYRALGPRTAEPSAEERSPEGRRAAVKALANHTAEEEDKILAATPAGRAARDSNWKKTEELFQEAAHRDPQLADPHRALGVLYSEQNRIDEARVQYREYLEMSPTAPDRLRIENRLAALDRPGTAH